MSDMQALLDVCAAAEQSLLHALSNLPHPGAYKAAYDAAINATVSLASVRMELKKGEML